MLRRSMGSFVLFAFISFVIIPHRSWAAVDCAVTGATPGALEAVLRGDTSVAEFDSVIVASVVQAIDRGDGYTDLKLNIELTLAGEMLAGELETRAMTRLSGGLQIEEGRRYVLLLLLNSSPPSVAPCGPNQEINAARYEELEEIALSNGVPLMPLALIVGALLAIGGVSFFAYRRR